MTEVLASAGEEVPGSVRDAVLARARRLSPAAREVLDIVGVVPGRAETWLVEGGPRRRPGRPVDECVAAGMLEFDGDALRFRHEIARSSIEEELSPMRRRELDRRGCWACCSAAPAWTPPALVHHARRGRRPRGRARRGPRRGARPRRPRARTRRRPSTTAAALDAVGDAPSEQRAELLEGLSEQAYLSGGPDEALATRREALAIRTDLGQIAQAGEDERWLSRLLWWAGQRVESEAAADRAVALLEPLGPSPGLAMAYSTLSQLTMLAWRTPETVRWGSRAIEMARELGDRGTLAHALNNVGTALSAAGDDEGVEMLEEAIEIATQDDEHDHAARGLVNLGWGRLLRREYASASRTIERGLAFARANDLRFYDQYLLGMRAWARLDTGDWAGAEEDGRAVLAIDVVHATISAHPGMVALGRMLVRRGRAGGDGADRRGVAPCDRRRRGAAPGARGVRPRRGGLARRRPRGRPPPRRRRRPGGRHDLPPEARADRVRGALLGVAGGLRSWTAGRRPRSRTGWPWPGSRAPPPRPSPLSAARTTRPTS